MIKQAIAAAMISTSIIGGLAVIGTYSPKSVESEVIPPVTTFVETSYAETTYIYRYAVPMSDDMQEYVEELCGRYELVTPAIVYAVIRTESDFDPYAKNTKSDCHGLMQICRCNFEKYNLTAPYNVKENIRVGVTMLGELSKKYGSLKKALMAYNCGEAGAAKLWAKGIEETSYTRMVVSRSWEILKKAEVCYERM